MLDTPLIIYDLSKPLRIRMLRSLMDLLASLLLLSVLFTVEFVLWMAAIFNRKEVSTLVPAPLSPVELLFLLRTMTIVKVIRSEKELETKQ